MLGLSFLKTYWEPIAIALILGGIILSVNHIKNQRDDAVKQLTDLRATYDAQKKENDTKLEVAKTSQKTSEAVAAKQITDLKIDRDTLTNAIRGYYETKPVKHSVGSTGGIVLPQPASSSSAETPTSTEGLTTSEPVSGGTCTAMEAKIKTLEDALATETVDFNRARAIIDIHCEQIGCLTD